MASVRSRASRRPALVRRRRLVAGASALLALVLLLWALLSGSGSLPRPPAAGLAGPVPGGAALAYSPGRQADFTARAVAGSSQVLFLKSPGGVLATAARVAQFRSQIVAAVRGSNIPPDLLEGLVFLESAGRPDVIAGNSVADAAGLTQILAGTGQSLLGMHINLARSRALTGAIYAAQASGNAVRAGRLKRARAAIDTRFEPARELAATVHYLEIAQRHLGGRVDLAIAAYHAGIGNLQQVLQDYDGGAAVPYAQLYFDTAPGRHTAAWQLLSSLGDDSSQYYWRVLGAEQIMGLYRSDPAALRHLSALETGYPSGALVLVPPGTVPRFADPAALAGAYQARDLTPLPRDPATVGLAYASAMGSLARRLGAPAALYRGLRPAALALLSEIGTLVRQISGVKSPLTVASTVLDAHYDQLLGFYDPPGTTGYTFQIERRYASRAQATAFQFVLDRLQALNLIAWIRGTDTIEITAAPDAGAALRHGV